MANIGNSEKVLKNIRGFISKYRFLFTREEFFAFQRKLHCVLKGEPSYEELKDLENSLLRYVSRLWQSELSNFEEYDEKSDFKFLVTCPTERADSYELRSKLSCSLITNKHLGTFNKIPVALCLSIDDDAILGISNRDMNSVSDDTGFLDDNYYYLNQYNGKKIYSKFQVDSLVSPDEIESSLINQNIQQNGNVLYLGDKSVYSDILVKGKKARVVGVLVMSHADETWQRESEILAEKFNVGIKRIDCPHYYRKVGLNQGEDRLKKYQLFDLTLIEAILLDRFHVVNGESNLYTEMVNRKVVVGSLDTPDYLMIDRDAAELLIIIKGDYRSIKLKYDGANIVYSIDDDIVSRSDIEGIINPVKKEKGK